MCSPTLPIATAAPTAPCASVEVAVPRVVSAITSGNQHAERAANRHVEELRRDDHARIRSTTAKIAAAQR
jgi:hypothetical protein